MQSGRLTAGLFPWTETESLSFVLFNYILLGLGVGVARVQVWFLQHVEQYVGVTLETETGVRSNALLPLACMQCKCTFCVL
jgi:hypothetical protein